MQSFHPMYLFPDNIVHSSIQSVLPVDTSLQENGKSHRPLPAFSSLHHCKEALPFLIKYKDGKYHNLLL